MSAAQSGGVTIQSEPVAAEGAIPNGGRRTGRLATVAFLFSAIGLGLLLGTGPVSIFAAPVGVILGLVALVTRRPGTRTGLAIAAVAIGIVVTVLSFVVILGSQPA